ncbi:MAG: hypothetical protein JSV99_04365 [Planctomycetota bacterium]|nr:MAG: hypothetical protein JSV99_04365 [Planctomycetota bacterium]
MLTPETEGTLSMEDRVQGKSIFGRVVVFGVVVVCALCTGAFGQPWDGNGVEGDPYQIWTAEDMQAIGADSNYWDVHFKLMTDIDLVGYSESNFNLIGIDWNDFFSGTFDGDGHSISNFNYTFSGPYNMGLFRYVSGSSALIRNVTLIDPNTNAGTADDTGILIGRIRNGATVSNCHIQNGQIVANNGNGTIGGLAGFNSGNIIDSSANVTVTGYGNVGGSVGLGGLVGFNAGIITNCYVAGVVDGNDYWAGGLVGLNNDNGVISHCYATASVEGMHYVGGLTGENWGSISDSNASGNVTGTWSTGGLVGFNRGSIARCHSQTNVTGDHEVGGLVGASYTGSISDCYATGDVLGGTAGSDDVGGFIGRTSDPILNCYADCNVTGANCVGGFVGDNASTLTHCYSAGSVYGNERVGGLIGENRGAVSSCYSVGTTVEGEKYIGGLAGLNITASTVLNSYSSTNVSCTWIGGGLVGRNNGVISNCYSVGSVSGMTYVGGLVGRNYSTVDNSFWNTETALPTTGSDGGTGKTTAEMQTESTFTSAGWDFTTPVWTIDEGIDYPRLWWEETQPVKYGGGSGDANDPYLIYTARQMNAIGAEPNDWGAHFKLMADIDLSVYPGTSFNIIGNSITKFTGVFDGSGHTISNFSYNSTGIHYISLFGWMDGADSEIKNLGMFNPSVQTGTGDGAASLINRKSNGTVSNCYAINGNISGNISCGGLVGFNERGTISNCCFTGSVSGHGLTGGFVGRNDANVIDCYADSNVSNDDYATGALVGYNVGTISSCFSTGTVSGHYYVGGLVGQSQAGISNSYSSASVSGTSNIGGLVGVGVSGTISNCYSTGIVSGSANLGGLLGYEIDCSATNSFWDVNTSGQASSAGGTGKITAEMQAASTFTDAGWDFNTPVWTICEGEDYPRLAWEKYGGGNGTEANPYLIRTSCQMNAIGAEPNDWDRHFKLMADIDLGASTGTEFNIIGNDGHAFTGVFDGNNRNIFNFTWASPDAGYVGLFGRVDDPNAAIKDLGLIDPNVDCGTGNWVGALVGLLWRGTVSGCYVENALVSGGEGYFLGGTGGLVGKNGGSILNCSSSGSISGIQTVGGLVGSNVTGTVSASYSTGSVYGSQVGGLVGRHMGGGLVINCSSDCDVSGEEFDFGGLAAYLTESSTISGCYASGRVDGDRNVGGLVGRSHEGIVLDSYSTGDVSGSEKVGGLVGVSDGAISKCYATGTATASWRSVGGLVGLNQALNGSGELSNSYATGNVSGGDRVGGLVGKNLYGELIHCYSAGSVAGSSNVGGLVGINDDGSVLNCFWDYETSGVGGGDGGTGKTTVEMQMESTFTDAGWDFVTPVWTICEGRDYPRLGWQVDLVVDIDIDELWMYQNLPGQTGSFLTVSALSIGDPNCNSSYSYAWEIVLPGDVSLAPVTVAGGGAGDAYWTFAARGCDEPGGLSDSGQTFTVRVTVTGDDYGNSGVAEAEFGIALLGDINNDGVVNVADRSIVNAFWRTGAAGPYTLRDCDVNCDGVVNVADRSIANAIWRGILGQNSVSSPCPLR